MRTTRPSPKQCICIRNVQKRGLSYNEYMLLLTRMVKAGAGRHALDTRLVFRQGVTLEDAAHFIHHGYV